jgi:hypothetical protein
VWKNLHEENREDSHCSSVLHGGGHEIEQEENVHALSNEVCYAIPEEIHE